MSSRAKYGMQIDSSQSAPLALSFGQLKLRVLNWVSFGSQSKAAGEIDPDNLYMSSEGLPFPSIEAYSAAKIDFNAAGGERGRRMSFVEWIASGRP